MGPVKDSYHRVAVAITITDIDLHVHDIVDKLIHLASLAGNYLHVIVDLQFEQGQQQDCLSIIRLFNEFKEALLRKWKVSMRESISERCLLTVLYNSLLTESAMQHLYGSSAGTEESVSESLNIHSLIISSQQSYQESVTYIHFVSNLLQGRSKLGVTLPQNDNHMYKLQRIIESVQTDSIQIIYFGTMSDPSLLELRKIDFVHSRGLNGLILLPDNYIIELSLPASSLRRPLLTSLARKYNKFELSILVKSLLQFGYMVGVAANGGTVEEHIWERYLFLCHPFVYRREFVSPTNIMAFTITTEDLEALAEASEAIEAEWDAEILPYATERAEIIRKTDDLGLLVSDAKSAGRSADDCRVLVDDEPSVFRNAGTIDFGGNDVQSVYEQQGNSNSSEVKSVV
jgi:hypothetical protein